MNNNWLFSDDDARMYLESCVFMHEGRPVKVERASKNQCLCTDLLSEEHMEVPTQSLDVVGSPGNVIAGDTYFYTERMPRRQARRSLNQSSLRICRMPWRAERERVRVRATSKEVANAIIKAYPSYDEAVDGVMSGTAQAIPFHKDWGIGVHNNIPHLIYKDTPVGAGDEGRIKLFSQYFFLTERLIGALNHELV